MYKSILQVEPNECLVYRALNRECCGSIQVLNCNGRIMLACNCSEDWRTDIKALLDIDIDADGYISTDTVIKHVTFSRIMSGGYYVKLFGHAIARIDQYVVYATLYNDMLPIADTPDNKELRRRIIDSFFDKGIYTPRTRLVYAELDTDIVPDFYFWLERNTVDLRDKVDLTVDYLTQVKFQEGSTVLHCVKYMPELKLEEGTDYAVIRVNGNDHLIMPCNGWVIFAIAPTGITTNTDSDEADSLLEEYVKHPYNIET